MLGSSIRDICANDLEVTAPKLRDPKMVIYNVPQDIVLENMEENLITQNPEVVLNQMASRSNSRLEPDENG